MARCQNSVVSKREKECVDDRQCDPEELVKDRKGLKMCQRGMVKCKVRIGLRRLAAACGDGRNEWWVDERSERVTQCRIGSGALSKLEWVLYAGK